MEVGSFSHYLRRGFVHPFGGCLGFLNHQQYRHPWNLKMAPWKRRSLVETIIFRFHSLNFGGVLIYDENQPVMWVNKPKTYMDVSKNIGFPPKSSNSNRIHGSIIFHIFFDTKWLTTEPSPFIKAKA